MRFYTGGCKISKLRDTEDCEGYISKWKQSHEEIEQIKKEIEEEIKTVLSKIKNVSDSVTELKESVRNGRI